MSSVEKILLDTDKYASVAVQEIAKSMRDAQQRTDYRRGQLSKDDNMTKLVDLPADELEKLKLNAQIIESIKSLNQKYSEAVVDLTAINAKLRLVRRSDPVKQEAIEASREQRMKRLEDPKNKELMKEHHEKDWKQQMEMRQRPRPGEAIPMVMNGEMPLESSLTKTLIDGAIASIDSNKNMTETGSIYTHDIHSEEILKEILQVLKGQGQTGAAGDGSTVSFNRIDTTELDRSINTFSGSIEELAKLMSGPIQMEVGGEINVNVNLTGAEILQENEGAIAKIAANKVTQGINNFVRNGLRSTSIAIKGDWTA